MEGRGLRHRDEPGVRPHADRARRGLREHALRRARAAARRAHYARDRPVRRRRRALRSAGRRSRVPRRRPRADGAAHPRGISATAGGGATRRRPGAGRRDRAGDVGRSGGSVRIGGRVRRCLEPAGSDTTVACASADPHRSPARRAARDPDHAASPSAGLDLVEARSHVRASSRSLSPSCWPACSHGRPSSDRVPDDDLALDRADDPGSRHIEPLAVGRDLAVTPAAKRVMRATRTVTTRITGTATRTATGRTANANGHD